QPLSADDAALVQRLRAGEARALGELQARYGPHLLAVVRRLVRDEALAEDVLQEGWLKVWAGIGRFDPARGRLFTWLARVCSNQAIDALRSGHAQVQRRTRPLEDSAAAYVADPAGFNPDHLGVRALLGHLPAPQRAVLELVYLQGWTHGQAADRLGIPVATAKTRARAGLRRLAGWAR
ncbi:RNA polymerase sigma factor, partial [Hymenobacter sp. B1770]|uniref:RNA polymerase sigma factor n=1 Tax=Hymenobacter sp. B1770 TaxID=1718788 RepID=UPI003CF684CD